MGSFNDPEDISSAVLSFFECVYDNVAAACFYEAVPSLTAVILGVIDGNAVDIEIVCSADSPVSPIGGMRKERISECVDAVVARPVRAGGSAHERNSHVAVVDIIAVFAVVHNAASEAAL